MKNKIIIIVLAAVLVALLVGAYALYSLLGDGDAAPDNVYGYDSSTDETVDESQLAADFTVYDRDGKAHRLSDFRGKPVILNFWASWCGPCQSEMPEFEDAYREYGEDIHFVMVNLTDGYYETLESAMSFIDASGYTFPVYYDTDVDAALRYDTSSIPVTFFIDERGVIAAYARGALNAESLKTGIGYIYGGSENES